MQDEEFTGNEPTTEEAPRTVGANIGASCNDVMIVGGKPDRPCGICQGELMAVRREVEGKLRYDVYCERCDGVRS